MIERVDPILSLSTVDRAGNLGVRLPYAGYGDAETALLITMGAMDPTLHYRVERWDDSMPML